MSETKKNQCYRTRSENMQIVSAETNIVAGIVADIFVRLNLGHKIEDLVGTIEELDKHTWRLATASLELKFYANGTGYHDTKLKPFSKTYSQEELDQAKAEAKLSGYTAGLKDMSDKAVDIFSDVEVQTGGQYYQDETGIHPAVGYEP